VALEPFGLTPYEAKIARGLIGETDPASIPGRHRVRTSR
jgi:hypothetical protein